MAGRSKRFSISRLGLVSFEASPFYVELAMIQTSEFSLEFTIQRYPTDSRLKYFRAYLEGEVVLMINQQVFLQEPHMLLAELGIKLKNWLAKRLEVLGLLPLEYFTMDHNESEGPIISLQPIDEEQYQISSIWQKIEGTVVIPQQLFADGAQSFIQRLEAELLSRGLVCLAN